MKLIAFILFFPLSLFFVGCGYEQARLQEKVTACIESGGIPILEASGGVDRYLGCAQEDDR